MGRRRRDDLPKHLHLSTLNHAYYYKNPAMPVSRASPKTIIDTRMS